MAGTDAAWPARTPRLQIDSRRGRRRAGGCDTNQGPQACGGLRMMLALSQAMMAVATACMGNQRRDWAAAMQAEFQMAVQDGHPMTFAAGCLMTAWRDMRRHAEGRFTLASYALGLGLFLPVAGVQIARVISFIIFGPRTPGEVLLATVSANPVLFSAQAQALPAIVLLWTSLGVGHLGLAWLLLDRNWSRIFKVGAAIVAAAVTLLLLMTVLLLDTTTLIPHIAMLVIELTILAAAARWHARLTSGALSHTASQIP